MDCRVCANKFGKFRIPLVLECGHSICKECIDQIYRSSYRCPYDNKKLVIPPKKLKPNYDLIALLLEKPSKGRKQYYILVIIILFLLLLLKLS